VGRGKTRYGRWYVFNNFKVKWKKPKTIQVKRCKSVLKGYKNKYRVIGTSIASHYKVNYLACISKHNLVLFRYDPARIELLTNGDVKLDESLLIKTPNLNKFLYICLILIN